MKGEEHEYQSMPDNERDMAVNGMLGLQQTKRLKGEEGL
jgi:hypothetical protein